MSKSPEGKEGLQSAVQILQETVEKFRVLDEKAKVLLAEKDVTGSTQKLKERARLLVDLPNRLSGALEGIDQETKQEILRNVSWFATSAQEALDSEGPLSLRVLLTDKGDRVGDKNDLENLIASLEGK